MDVVCTGFTGHLGQTINKLNNINFINIAKTTSRSSKTMNFNFDKDTIKDKFFIHAAWNLESRNKKDSHDINVKGTLDLIKRLEELDFDLTKFVFISTINASPKSKSVYEKDKFTIEEIILEKGGYVLKPGIIYDNKDPFSGGLLGNLYKLAKTFPILPNFTGIKKVYYLTSSECFINHIEKILMGETGNTKKSKLFNVGPIDYKTLVNQFMKLEKTIIRIPWLFGYIASKLFESLNINFPLKSDSLLSLK